MKVLICSYTAAAHSSYGSQTRELWTRLLATRKYEIMQHGWFHRETIDGVRPPWNIYPTNTNFDDEGAPRATLMDRYGQQSFDRVCQQFKPDIVWGLADPFMLDYLAQYKDKFGFKLAIWTPIDGVPVPEGYRKIVQAADAPFGVTEWGADLMEFIAERPVGAIHHGVDVDVFYRDSDENRAAMRAKAAAHTDCPEHAYVLGFLGKNQFRKMPWIIYPVVYYLNSGHWVRCLGCDKISLGEYDCGRRRPLGLPSTCHHCGDEEEMVKGKPIPTRMWVHMYEKEAGVNFKWLEHVWNVPGYFSYSEGLSPTFGYGYDAMRTFYNVCDVYMSLSGGEGFCLPIIEAAACGVPTVYTDYSGQAEVGRICGGLPVKAAAMINEHHTEMHINRAVPDLSDAIDKLYQLSVPLLREDASRKAIQAVEKNFSWNLIVPQWHKALMELHERKGDQRMLGVIA